MKVVSGRISDRVLFIMSDMTNTPEILDGTSSGCHTRHNESLSVRQGSTEHSLNQSGWIKIFSKLMLTRNTFICLPLVHCDSVFIIRCYCLRRHGDLRLGIQYNLTFSQLF